MPIREIVRSLVERSVIPLLLHIAVLCLLCVLLSLPPVWNTLYSVTMHSELLSDKRGSLYVKDASIISDALWESTDFKEVSRKLDGYWLGEREQRHFEDVRRLLRRALIVAVGLILALFLLRKLFRWRTVWSYAVIFCVVEVLLFGVWSMVAWRGMFRTLHWWIFQNDSWILPNNSYTLYLFSHEVWKVAGLSVSSSFLTIITAGFIVSRRLPLEGRVLPTER